MRRIVAGEPDGEGSRVLSDARFGAANGPPVFRFGGGQSIRLPAIPDEASSSDVIMTHLWESPGPELARVGVDSATEATEYEWVPGPEGMFWRYQIFGPGRSSASHRTETLDMMFVIQGEVTLILDQEDVLLRAGDALVLQAASHGWRAGSEGCSTIHLMRRLT